MSAGSVPTLTATGAVLSAQDVKLAQVRIDQSNKCEGSSNMFDTSNGVRAITSVHHDDKLKPATRNTGDTLHIRADTQYHTEEIPDLVATSKAVSFADQDGSSNKSLSDIKTYECDGQMRRPKSWARKAAKKKSAAASGATMRGIVDTGATLHLMKDESMDGLIDSIQSNQSVIGFSGNISQPIARKGYKHIHFYNPQNAKQRGVTLRLPVSTMKNIEDNIFSASKLVKAMRFKCNLRPDPLDGEDPTPDDWEGFFKIQGGVPYRIPIQYDGDQRMWYMHFGIGDTPSAAARDGILRARKQQVDLSDDKQIDYRHHAAKVCIVDRHTPHDMYQAAPYGSQYLPDTSAAPEIEGGPPRATQKTHTDTDATLQTDSQLPAPDAERAAASSTTADAGPEPEPEEPLPSPVETQSGTPEQDNDRSTVELDQDVEWKQIQPFVRPTQRSQSIKLNETERHRRLGHMGKCPRGGCAICQQAHGTHRRVYSNPTPIYCPIPGHKIWAAARTAVCRRPGLSDV
jgi:hypothetical protein